MITETQIDDIIDNLERQDDKVIIAEIAGAQPALLSYILSDSFKILTTEENKILIFLFLVIYSAFGAELEAVDPESIEIMEDKNWEIYTTTSGQEFHEKITPFFKEYAQEDLLAFVEDTLVEDEDSRITGEGRSVVFIAMRTVIDCLIEGKID